LTVNAATLVSLAVIPATASIPAGTTQQFTAIATFSFGPSIDVTANALNAWGSGTLAVATVGLHTGSATGVAPGTSLITATFGGKTATATLTVNAATSKGLTLTPTTASIPVTGNQQYTVWEIFSDGTSQNRTTASSWTTSNNAGNVTLGLTPGLANGIIATPAGVPVTITAAYGGMSGNATLTVNAATSMSFAVTPATASIPATGNQQYTAIETFSDGSTLNRTASSNWSSGTPGVALVGLNTGLALGVAPGNSTITATYGGMSRSATLTVNAATSKGLTLSPALASIPRTGNQQYTLLEIFSDGTSQPRTTDLATAWTTSNNAGNISLTPIGVGAGLATGLIATPIGTPVTIKATYGGNFATADLTVTAATSTKFEVTPKAATISINGGTQQYTAIETFSDGTTQDRTRYSNWSAVDLVPVSTTPVATIWNTSPRYIGRATGVNLGTSTIMAEYGVYTGNFGGTVGLANRTAILTVTAPNPGPASPYPILGTASTYGMIASDAMTIVATPMTHIYGDVALINNDSFVGFSLTGNMPTHPTSIYVTPRTIPGINSKTLGDTAAAVQAQADLNAAYADLSARPALATAPTETAGGTYPAGVVELSGKVLVPGIYRTAMRAATDTFGLSSINGPLVLDAKGNPDALFILQASDITTTTGSVLLQGGAQPKNVYWVMTHTATIGDGTGTVFQGTVVAGGTITVKGANVEGRMLAGALGAGAITISAPGSVITVPAD